MALKCLSGTNIYVSNPYYQPPSPIVSAVINYAYKLGSAVIVSITNTGNTIWTFVVGATAVKNSYCGAGCTLNACGNPYVDLPAQYITLAPGQTGTVTFNVGPAFQSLGTTVGWVIVKVWQYAFSNCLAGTVVWVNLY
jgi:hypothetical protein